MSSTVRFLREYLRPTRHGVATVETTYRRGAETLPATVYRPAGARTPLPGWVILHGLTATGRGHASLTRFARAVAASGTVVLIPEIPEWRALRVAPGLTIPTIRSAVLALDERGETEPGRIGLLGFSFGATQGLVAAADPTLDGHLAAVAAWGGYCDPHRLFRFGLSGEHELDGTRYRIEPDPYGAWIIAGNYLTTVPGHESDGDVADALYALALEAGRRGVFAGDPLYDESKLRMRAALPAAKRELFDLFAPLSGAPRDRTAGEAMAGRLADAAVARDPLLDPAPALPHVRTPTLLAHGAGDRLIPFTETVRLSRRLPAEVVTRVGITSLFAHSGGDSQLMGPIRRGREMAGFVGLLNAILDLV